MSKNITAGSSDILARFQQVLIDYYDKGRQRTDGLPHAGIGSKIARGICHGNS